MRHAGKAMDGVKRKPVLRRSKIAWIRQTVNLDCNWHEKGTESGEIH